ncbi:MAG: hypothetical protein N2746_10570 [Deltaproteobacteria bacterium]|nr:hypothetical protein [Deltaproteobacteria bacterium]
MKYRQDFKSNLIYILLSIWVSSCSREYNIGKIHIIDETNLKYSVNISDIAEKLIKGTTYLDTTEPSKSNSSLKITLSEINISTDKSKVINRYNVTLTLTTTTKGNGIQIFQTTSSLQSDINQNESTSQIRYLLHDAFVKLDYQCKIRKFKEEKLFKAFESKKTIRWMREAILDEINNRLNSNSIQDNETAFNFLYNCFLKQPREFGDKIIGILSSYDFSKIKLDERTKDQISLKLARYCLEREPHIQIHTINILGKIDTEIARSIIFTLSTGSVNRSVREHAKEVLSELEKRNNITNNIFTSK